MTLREAFRIWCEAPGNAVLANRYRIATDTVLMKNYGDTDLSLITEEYARHIFDSVDTSQELKIRAASVLVHLLQWGGDNGHCQRPTFDYSIARSPESRVRKPTGRAPRPVAQIDPDTLEVVKVWPTMSDAERDLNARNISRAMELVRKSVGFYWCDAAEADTFRERLAAKQKKVASVRQTAVARLRESHPKVRKPGEKDTATVSHPDPGGVPAGRGSLKSHSNAAQAALQVFTDRELIDELERRGWIGCFSRTELITIGQQSAKGKTSKSVRKI